MSNYPHKQTPTHAHTPLKLQVHRRYLFKSLPTKNKNSPNSQRSQFGIKSVLHQMPSLPTLTAHSITSCPAYCILHPAHLPHASWTGRGNVWSEDIFLTNSNWLDSCRDRIVGEMCNSQTVPLAWNLDKYSVTTALGCDFIWDRSIKNMRRSPPSYSPEFNQSQVCLPHVQCNDLHCSLFVCIHAWV